MMNELNNLLHELGISKVKLAKFLGVSRQMIYNYLELDDVNKWPKDKKVLLFNLLGIKSYDEMKKMYEGAVITRANFADYLVRKGYVKSRNEVFDRYLGDSKPCYVPREKMLPEKAIKMIKSVGGVPVLAHPVLYHMGNEQMNKLMDYLCEHGIAGLEAVYSTYTMGDELEMKHIAKERNLLISGGSDYHGANKPDIELGTGRGHLFVPEEILTKIKEYKNNI